jgi:basic membrane protein A
MKKVTKVLAVLLVLAMVFAFAACKGAEKNPENEKVGLIASPLAAAELTSDVTVPDDFKVGFIFLHDENSTYDLNFINAAKNVQKILGLADEQVILNTNIPEGQECFETAEDLVEQGCKVIFADSFGHEAYMIEAAKKYPNVQFCHSTGTKAHTEGLKNYHNAFADIYEGRYLAGIAAGLKLNEMIAAGKFTAEEAKIGYVGAFTYAEVMSGYSSFFLGARSVCPTATMEVTFTGSWYDEAAEKEAANKLIADNCKLISQHADSMGAPTACEAAGVPDVSYNGSTYDACENTFIISSRIDWTPYFLFAVEKTIKGEEIPADWCGGIAEGSIVLTDINGDVAAEGTLDAIKTAIDGFKAGTLHVYDINTFTVDGKKLESYQADVDDMGDFKPETEVIKDGYFAESEFRSAPYFDVRIDGITLLDENYG